MSHTTAPLTSSNTMRYNRQPPGTGTPKPWHCLWCGTPTVTPFRGCCGPTCARLEHDTDNYDPED